MVPRYLTHSIPPMSGVDRCRMLVLPTTPPPYRPAPKVRQPISAPHDDQIPIAQATARTPRFPPSSLIRRAGRLTSGLADRSVFGRRPARRITLNGRGRCHPDIYVRFAQCRAQKQIGGCRPSLVICSARPSVREGWIPDLPERSSKVSAIPRQVPARTAVEHDRHRTPAGSAGGRMSGRWQPSDTGKTRFTLAFELAVLTEGGDHSEFDQRGFAPTVAPLSRGRSLGSIPCRRTSTHRSVRTKSPRHRPSRQRT